MTQGSGLVKCLIWDLDNTLWHGTLLEDEDVRLTDEIRGTVRELDRRGILQSVVSRNDHHHAWERLEEFGIAEYLILPRIGWGRKSDSVKEIITELGFNEDTVAFIDDQPYERAEVGHFLPTVRCYPADQASSLTELPEFTPAVVTADASRRRAMYQARILREAEQASYQGPDEEFLRSLDMKMEIIRARREDLTRVEELTLRTSQMNATGIHYSEKQLLNFVTDPDHEVLIVTLADRFGPHGTVGVILVERCADAYRIKLLATSCRVVAFGVGTILLRWLDYEARKAGVHLIADFRGTDRNRMMEIAYRFAGLREEDCECLAAPRAAAAGDGIQQLHRMPVPQPPVTTMSVLAADLADLAAPAAEWAALGTAVQI